MLIDYSSCEGLKLFLCVLTEVGGGTDWAKLYHSWSSQLWIRVDLEIVEVVESWQAFWRGIRVPAPPEFVSSDKKIYAKF